MGLFGHSEPTLEDKLLDAVRAGDAQAVHGWLEVGADPLKPYSKGYNKQEHLSGRNAMHYNAIQGNAAICDLLMEPQEGIWVEGANRAFSYDANSKSPVHYALEHNHLAIARSHLQYDGFDAYRFDAGHNSIWESAKSAKAQQLVEEHRPRNPVVYDIPSRLQKIFSGESDGVVIHGAEAIDHQQEMAGSMRIEQPTKMFSAESNDWIDNPTYQRPAKSGGIER